MLSNILPKTWLQGLYIFIPKALYIVTWSLFKIYSLKRPSNILLNEYSELKLSDFGLAKKLIDMF
jgi:serine/threonine protein kinase